MKQKQIIISFLFFFCFLENAFSQSSLTLTCDEDRWLLRNTENTERNLFLMNACSFIQNGQYDSARVNLSRALEMSDDAYLQGVLEKLDFVIQEKKSNSQVASETTPTAEEKKSVEPEPAPATSDKKTPDPIAVKVEPEKSDKNVVDNKPVNQAEPVVKEAPPVVTVNEPKDVAVVEKSDPENNTSESKTEITKPNTRTFTDEEIKVFQEKGLLKVNQFEVYINKIGDKTTSQSQASSDIDNALQLFDSEDHFVQVSSLKRPDKPKYKVRKYLEKVRALNYDQVKIEWADFQYASKFRKAPDGNYYGFIKFRQRFTAIKDGDVIYTDITDKTIAVILKPFAMAVNGSAEEVLEVFLGDVEVVQTMNN